MNYLWLGSKTPSPAVGKLVLLYILLDKVYASSWLLLLATHWHSNSIDNFNQRSYGWGWFWFDFNKRVSNAVLPWQRTHIQHMCKHTKMTTHICNRTITTQVCREIVTHTNQLQNSHISKNRSSLKVAKVKISIGTAFYQWMTL